MTIEHNDHALLTQSFYECTGRQPSSISALRQHASDRRIYRVRDASLCLIGVVNPVREENDAFVSFARFFSKVGLPVPAIHYYDAARHVYLEDDLGDTTLFDFLHTERTRTGELFPHSVETHYQAALDNLLRFQVECASSFDFTRCYPETDLLPGTFAGDCAAFGTDLVARLLPDFDITSLTKDFVTLIDFLEDAEDQFFVYRDFQSRNIMLTNGKPFFIDFQSGRRGPLQYDVASLLYQSSTRIPTESRKKLARYYVTKASSYHALDQEAFYRFYSGFIVCRMLQVLGVYGRQGLAAGKRYFADSIPAAVETLSQELHAGGLPLALPKLSACVARLRDKLSQSGVV
jgi:aminoglycoside/choline kinase family phosphotransferase